MLQIEEISNKYTRIYHTSDDITKLTLRIRLIEDTNPDNEDIALLKWQQKRFSQEEITLYKDLDDCHTDLAKEYHHQITKETRRGRLNKSQIFTYTENDDYHPEEGHKPVKSYKNPPKPDDSKNKLVQRIEQLNIDDNNDKIDNTLEGEVPKEVETKNYDYFDYLYENYNKPVLQTLQTYGGHFETFYIMADFGEFYNETWLPTEHVLCALRYNSKLKTLEITPDFNIFTAYSFSVTSDETKTYSYWIENASLESKQGKNEISKHLRLETLQENLRSSQVELEHRDWGLPSSATYVQVLMEIIGGRGFDDDVFVKYYLGLRDWKLKTLRDEKSSERILTGVSVTSSRKSSSGMHHFNCVVEWHLILTEFDNLPKDPVVFFELISKDTWQRYRSEGFCHLNLPLNALNLQQNGGRYVFHLPCARVTSPGINNELRRFFIGDSGNFNDLEQLKLLQNGLNTNTIATGVLDVAVSVLRVRAGVQHGKQFSSFEQLRGMRLRETLKDPMLTKTVDDAVAAFKKARDAMVEARAAAGGDFKTLTTS